MNIDDIKLSDVMSVYSGKAGACCCGCAGKRTYAKAHQDVASKDRGYEVFDKECRDGTVKRIFNKAMDSITSGGDLSISPGKEGGFVSHVSVEIGERVYIIYMRPWVDDLKEASQMKMARLSS
jgi:hypothetical protein